MLKRAACYAICSPPNGTSTIAERYKQFAKARGLGSVGRASRLHREGQRFESASLQNLNEGLLNLLLNRDIEPKATRADIKEE